MATSIRSGAAALFLSAVCACLSAGCADSARTLESFSFAWERDLGVESANAWWGHQLALDHQSNIIVGVARGDTSQEPPCAGLIKLASDGSLLWSRPFDTSVLPPSTSCPHEVRLAMNDDDTLILAGSAVGIENKYLHGDVLVRKLSADVETEWTIFPSLGGVGLDIPWDLAIDPQGSIIVAGSEGRESPTEIPWIAKYDADGKQQWRQAPEGVSGRIANVKADKRGDLTLVNELRDEDSGAVSSSFEKRSTDGDLLWQVWVQTLYPGSLAMDAEGSAFILTTEDGGQESRLRKYSALGTLLWTAKVSGGGETFEVDNDDKPAVGLAARRVAPAPDGSIYVAGQAQIIVHQGEDGLGTESNPALVLWRYDADGKMIWGRIHAFDIPSVIPSSIEIRDITVSSDGRIALIYDDVVAMIDP